LRVAIISHELSEDLKQLPIFTKRTITSLSVPSTIYEVEAPWKYATLCHHLHDKGVETLKQLKLMGGPICTYDNPFRVNLIILTMLAMLA
jgi:hypothetical protein